MGIWISPMDGGDTIECVRRFSARMINCMTTNVAYNKHFL